jgi:capsule polysaccharide export protein KpsE/RkpR
VTNAIERGLTLALEPSSISDEAFFKSYATKVSGMNNWQISLELANRMEEFDHLNEEVELAELRGNNEQLRKMEKARDDEARKIEILHAKWRLTHG